MRHKQRLMWVELNMRRKAIGFGDNAGMNIDKGLIVEASQKLPQMPENDRLGRLPGHCLRGCVYASDPMGKYTPQMPLLTGGVINETDASGALYMAKDNQ